MESYASFLRTQIGRVRGEMKRWRYPRTRRAFRLERRKRVEEVLRDAEAALDRASSWGDLGPAEAMVSFAIAEAEKESEAVRADLGL